MCVCLFVWECQLSNVLLSSFRFQFSYFLLAELKLVFFSFLLDVYISTKIRFFINVISLETFVKLISLSHFLSRVSPSPFSISPSSALFPSHSAAAHLHLR